MSRLALAPPKLWLTRDRRWVAAAIALALTVFALSWYRHATYRSTTYDLGVFEQALWKLSHGRSPLATTIGWNIFADHLSPVLTLFVPLFRIAATPVWLFAAQGVAAGLGLLALPPLLDEIGVVGPAFGALVLAYVASPLLWNATVYDFHPTTLAIPLVLVGITAALRDRLPVLVAVSVGLILLRDDLGAAVTALAFIGWGDVSQERRRQRLLLAGAGLAWVAFGSRLGQAMGADRNWHFHYGYLAAKPIGAVAKFWTTIPRLARHVFRRNNLTLVGAWLLPFGLLPLLRPTRLVAVGLLGLPLLASAGLQFHSPHFHYGAPLLPFLLAAAAAALRRVPPRLAAWPAAVAIMAGTAASMALWGPPSTNQLDRVVAPAADIRRALRLVRPGDGVTVGSTLGPRLAYRALLLPFPAPFTQGRHDFPLAASVRHVSAERAAQIDVVIVDVHELTHTRRAYGHFLVSPYLAGFHMHRIGEIIVWTRTPR